MAYKYGVVVINDVLKEGGKPLVPNGLQYGYARKDIKKVQPVEEDSEWIVQLPAPGRMVRDYNGYWTTDGGGG